MDITTTDGKKVSFEPYVLYARNENKYPKRDFIILSRTRLKMLDTEEPIFVRFALDKLFCPRVHFLFINAKNAKYFANFHKASIKEIFEWKRLFNDDKLDFDSDAYALLHIDRFMKDIHKNNVTWEKVGKND
jgi:hypothetical protein